MTKYIYVFIGGIAFGCLIMFLFGRSAPANPTKSNFKITGPDGKVAIEFGVEGDGTDYEKVLEKMFSNTFLKGGALKWLSDKQGVFP